jgi:hypothetical protein
MGNSISGTGIRDGNDAVHHILAVAPPRKSPVVFFVMKVEKFPVIRHELIGYSLIRHGKIEIIGLNRTSRFGTQTRLYQFTLIGLENISLLHQEIQFTGLCPFPKEKEILPVNKSCCQKQKDEDDGPDCLSHMDVLKLKNNKY